LRNWENWPTEPWAEAWRGKILQPFPLLIGQPPPESTASLGARRKTLALGCLAGCVPASAAPIAITTTQVFLTPFGPTQVIAHRAHRQREVSHRQEFPSPSDLFVKLFISSIAANDLKHPAPRDSIYQISPTQPKIINNARW